MTSLYQDNCFNIFPSITDHSVNLICCDPPYGASKALYDKPLSLPELWIQYERILAPKGNIILFGTGLFAFKLALSNEKLFRYDMVWIKSKCGSPLTSKYMPMKKHEHILVFGHSNACYYPQMTIGKPYKRKNTAIKTNNMNFGIKSVQSDNKGTRQPTTILNFPQKWRRQDQLHYAQKPIELLKWLIFTYSKENDMVLDNCMGIGTCGIAAKELNRNFIGIEIDKNYFSIANEKINTLF